MTATPSLEAQLATWIGRSETRQDVLSTTPCQALAATLDRSQDHYAPGDALPPLWHWLYFLPMHAQSELGPDGHAQRGGFMPPVPLPRRMWAGSQFEFHQPLHLGEAVERRSTIADVKLKHGRTGPLVFVKVRHELRRIAQECGQGPGPVTLTEFHDIVYREARQPGDVEPPPIAAPAGVWRRTLVPDDVLLFRYSALTFNGHRIHYDRRYVTEVEGYPGLIVHGPLIATLLLDLLRREMPGAQVASFQFKVLRPTFDGQPMHLNAEPQADGRSYRLWAQDHQGWLTMQARVNLA